MEKNLLFEACVGNYNEAVEAEKRGASRIELCDNLLEGGTTPSYGTIKKAMENIKLPINVIIRPRGGDFVYSKEEFEIMVEDIKICKQLNVNGIVIGCLRKDNTIDEEGLKLLVENAEGLSVTFHMAFDEIDDKKKAIDKLVEYKIDRILSKGGEISATNNLDTLKDLIEYANDRIVIMPGGGVNKDNKYDVANHTGAKEVHGTKIV